MTPYLKNNVGYINKILKTNIKITIFDDVYQTSVESSLLASGTGVRTLTTVNSGTQTFHRPWPSWQLHDEWKM